MKISQKIIAVILARGGSKRVPNKNLRRLCGKPLLHWTLQTAVDAQVFSEIILSSDNDEILEFGKNYPNVTTIKRPSILASDDSTSVDAILHGIADKTAEHIALLQPTSPLRTKEDIRHALAKYFEKNANSLVSIVETDVPPEWIFRLDPQQSLVPVVSNTWNRIPHQRQAALPSYTLNGAIYITSADKLRENKTFLQPCTIGYIMPPERSVDIDTFFDFEIAEKLIANSK